MRITVWILAFLAIVLAIVLFACSSEESSTQNSQERSAFVRAESSTPAQSAEALVRPSIFITEEDDLRLAFQFKNVDGTETERRIAGLIPAESIRSGECFRTKSVITEYRTSGADAAMSVIACIEENGDIKIGLRGRRDNDDGAQGDRFILGRIRSERQEPGVWFHANYRKPLHEFIPRPEPRRTVPSRSTPTWTGSQSDLTIKDSTTCILNGGTWRSGRCSVQLQRPVQTQSVQSACQRIWGSQGADKVRECVSYCNQNKALRSEMCGRR